MPSRRRAGEAQSNGASTSTGIENSQGEEDTVYKMKRKKNNEAVQRTREKSRKSAEERKKHIESLKEENIRLKAKIQKEKESINLMRELIIHGEKSENHDRIIQDILENPSEDDDEIK